MDRQTTDNQKSSLELFSSGELKSNNIKKDKIKKMMKNKIKKSRQ
jgi:hypothetical protein